ncbi:hypothetical protein B7463_g5657, partial [Scytalidium lignicola]
METHEVVAHTGVQLKAQEAGLSEEVFLRQLLDSEYGPTARARLDSVYNDPDFKKRCTLQGQSDETALSDKIDQDCENAEDDEDDDDDNYNSDRLRRITLPLSPPTDREGVTHTKPELLICQTLSDQLQESDPQSTLLVLNKKMIERNTTHPVNTVNEDRQCCGVDGMTACFRVISLETSRLRLERSSFSKSNVWYGLIKLSSRCFTRELLLRHNISTIRSETDSSKCEWVSPNCIEAKFEPTLKFCANHLIEYQHYLQQYHERVQQQISTSVRTPLASWKDILLAFLTTPAQQIPVVMIPVFNAFNGSNDSGSRLIFGDTEFTVGQRKLKEFAVLAHPSGKRIHRFVSQTATSPQLRQAIFDDLKDFLTPTTFFVEFSNAKLDLPIIL